ncbi:hypothetical protein FE697_011875 [Mumia zhuanghuii]|uniref:ABC transporter permease n=2 Tax=Mumia TaxID=1546255 RepID=A0ABW1QI34_9ACTN|nr:MULTISPECIES: hypothetical protein [Mumia]KAA1422844.1 hypothetical protein FE697_011875 [Mumia zhuanghuii]
MSTTTRSASAPAWGRAAGAAALAAFVVTLVVAAFVWPAATTTPHDLPVVVTGPPAAVDGVTATLEESAPGRFDLATVADREAAVEAVEQRDAYGAIVLGAEPEVLTASAAGGPSHQAMLRLADELSAALAARSGAPAPPTPAVTVTDVASLSTDDAQGIGMTAAAFPLVIGGIAGGVVISLLVTGRTRRLAALALYAVLAGASTTAVVQGWFDILQGSAVENAGAIGLAFLATSSMLVGLSSLIGRAGIGVGALLTLLVANPIASAAQPPEFLPGAWGEIGQLFVPGAALTLLRSLSYFPEADLARPLLVLGAWAAAGIAMVLIGRKGDDPDTAAPAPREEAEATYATA